MTKKRQGNVAVHTSLLISFLIASLFLLISLAASLAQESPFAVEEISILEEEFAEEVEIIEDRAGTTPDSLLYVVDEIIENVNLALKEGEEKAEYALEVKQEKVAEAALMAAEQKQEETAQALERAQSVSPIIEKEISPRLLAVARDNTEFSQRMLAAIQKSTPAGWEEVGALLDEQVTAEEKIRIAGEIASKVGEYCEELSYVDYNAVLADQYCNPDAAPSWLKEAVEGEMSQREEAALEKMIQEITTCVNDPRSCRCDDIPVEKHQQECEENKALAIRCEFEQDFNACKELEQKPLVPPDTPDFLRPAFEETLAQLIEQKKQEMFDKFAPPECKEAGLTTPEECESLMREKYGEPPEECQQDGKFIGMEECMAIVIEKYDIPSECIRDGRPIGKDECIALMASSGQIPAECMEGGNFIGREECEEKMSAQFEIPEACKDSDGKFIGREECEQIMREQVAGQFEGGFGGGGGAPADCLEDGEFIGMDECTALIQERIAAGEFPGGFPGGPSGEFPGGGFPGGESPDGFPGGEGGLPEGLELPPELFDAGVLESLTVGGDQHLVIGEGGAQLVGIEELQQLREQAEQALEQESEHSPVADQLREALTQLEEAREAVERGEEVAIGEQGEIRELGEESGERGEEAGGEEHEESAGEEG
ncbi:MAG: DUF5667 domain-containing protein, partial [Nanoarchaeota archaeon]